MFTGIVQTTAPILDSTPTETGRRLTVQRGKLRGDVNHGDSICVSGVCLTAVEITAEQPWDQTTGTSGAPGSAMHRKHMWSRIQLYERYREAFLSTLTGGDCQLGAAAIRALVSQELCMSLFCLS